MYISVRASDKRIACDEEFSDSEDEGEGGRRNVADHKKGAKKARMEEDKKETEDKKAGQIYFLADVFLWCFLFGWLVGLGFFYIEIYIEALKFL